MGAAKDWFIEKSKRKSERRNGGKNLFFCMFGMGILILILINFQKRNYTKVCDTAFIKP